MHPLNFHMHSDSLLATSQTCICFTSRTIFLGSGVEGAVFESHFLSSNSVLSGSSSTTPTPVSSDDVVSSSGQTSTAETVKVLQSASGASAVPPAGGGGGGGGRERGTGDTVTGEGEEEDNVVTTIDEVCVE